MSIHAYFNNYYFILLKKLKDISRPNKKKEPYRSLIHAIKSSYAEYDTSSTEYFDRYETYGVSTDWSEVATVEAAKDWLEKHQEVSLYEGINIKLAREVCNDDALLLYFIVALNVLVQNKDTFTEDDIKKFNTTVLSIQKSEEFKSAIESYENDNIKVKLLLMEQLYKSQSSGLEKELENTSLGRLAKSIMDKVDVSSITATLDADGDILKTLSNPNIASLLGTVSQELIKEMAAGNINQETLMNDAKKFTQGMQKAGGMPAGMPDISGMMGMFQTMMSATGGSEGGMGAFADIMAGMNKAKRPTGGQGSRQVVDTSAMSRLAKAKQLNKKLHDKKKAAAAKSKEINATDMLVKEEKEN